jgi:hypothetical protein
MYPATGSDQVLHSVTTLALALALALALVLVLVTSLPIWALLNDAGKVGKSIGCLCASTIEPFKTPLTVAASSFAICQKP